MSSQPDRPLTIEVTVTASQPELLEGLDVWLRLGLLGDAQVRQLSQTYLACLLPQPVVAATESEPQRVALAPSIPSKVDTPLRQTPRQSRLFQMWHSLRDEISVRWLLFLGVFLVVVSSGVLAATQWRNFPAAGQYGVLWVYTVIFWFGSFWAGKQRSLQLTAQTLRLIALLLVPVNFWAMDSFRLWRHPGEWIVLAIASVTLTIITLLYQEIRANSSRLTSNATLLLWLSYLHWGWHWSEFPLVAVYLGMVGTAIFLPRRFATVHQQQQLSAEATSSESVPRSQWDIQLETPIGSSIVIYALTVLLGRGIFVVQLPIAQLGLAIGICGWLFARLGLSLETTRSPASSFQSKIWERLGAVLLAIGWLVSVREKFPWQTTAVSGLGLWFFASRLQRFWRHIDLIAIFIIGLQAHWLLWRLLPPLWQQQAIAFFTQVTNSQNVPVALLGLALFPYATGMIRLTDWLHRANKPHLASFAEQLTLGLGLMLTLISLLNPIVRSLNLLFSTLTLAIITSRWSPTRTGLVYLTHVTGLLTLASVINWLLPNLSQPVWASILLFVMVAEWAFSLGSNLLPHSPLATSHPRIWQRSAWHLGFVLSGLSYVLLLNHAYPSGVISTRITKKSELLWLLTPLALTGIASRTSQPRRRWAASFSVATLAVAQALTLAIPGTRLVNLGIATGLMWVNTRYLQELGAAIVTVGFGLSWVGMLLWEGIPGLPRLSESTWFLVGAIALCSLWLLRSWLMERNGTLVDLYARACDGWALALCSVELMMLTLHSVVIYGQFDNLLLVRSPSWEYLIASFLIVAANLYRLWQQPTNLGIYGIGWGVELGVAEAVKLAGGSTLELATVTIILGLVALFGSDWWLARQRRAIFLGSVEILPLLYALLGLGLRFGYFTSWTGLLALGAALTGVGVGRRRVEWKPLTYLSLAGISFAWYELVIYQMLQAKGGSPADASIVLASVAVAIAFAYRLLAWCWQSRSAETLLILSVVEIKITAHIHWGIGSLLIMLAALSAIPSGTVTRLTGVGIILCLLLATYALVQGRQQAYSSTTYSWVYLGFMEVAATYVYARLMWTQLSVLDAWLAIITCGLAYGIYELPWTSWGWPQIPWKRASLVLPALTVLGTIQVVSDASLLLVAGFYVWSAFRSFNIRLTYISVALVDWAIVRWFDRLQLTDSLWYVTIFGLSLLYIAQFDPDLQQSEQRQIRHYLRILGSGVICLVALLFHQKTGLLPGIISTITIFAGLLLRVRAFLFVGTATFLLTAFYQLVILISRYSFVKWVVGLIAGIIFIGMAANFETRREQIASAFRNSRTELGGWE
jgi:hypothetical protein